jgi:hypothetical protein
MPAIGIDQSRAFVNRRRPDRRASSIQVGRTQQGIAAELGWKKATVFARHNFLQVKPVRPPAHANPIGGTIQIAHGPDKTFNLLDFAATFGVIAGPKPAPPH